MAEKRTTAPTDDAGTAVPRARTADPDPEPEPEPELGQEPGQAAKPAKKATKKAAKKTAAPAKQASKQATKKAVKKVTKQAAKKAGPATPAPPAPSMPAAPEAWAAAAWDAVRRPEQPPQRLAELAVAEAGPRAAGWAAWLRETYPGAPADGIARLATRRAGQLGQLVALGAAAGAATAPFCLPAAGWVRASVVLRIAAAYGHDPADPRRAGELIELLGVGPDPDRPASEPWVMVLARRLRFLRFVPGRLRLRRGPFWPVLRLLTSTLQEGDELERLAHRAARFYRSYPGSASSTSVRAESISSENSP